MRSHLMMKLVFYLFSENMIFRKDLESPLIFVLFFLRENKIIKKTPSMTPYLEKKVYEKPNTDSGSGCLLERYDKDRTTPKNRSLLNKMKQT